jgi:thioredoxin-related protein
MGWVKFLGVAVFSYALLIAAANAAQLVVVEIKSCGVCKRFNATVAPGYGATAQGRKAPLKRVMIGGAIPAALKGKVIRGTPTFILMDKGREIGRFDGFSNKGAFYARLNGLLAKLP